ncbi:hypothetical protein AB9E13_36060, partial [Rhizobium leguminosarum]
MRENKEIERFRDLKKNKRSKSFEGGAGGRLRYHRGSIGVRQMKSRNGPLRVGIGGPVGSGKTAL